MATINGQPSIFKSVETPTENIPTYETRIADFVVTAKEMATDAELKAHAKTEAEKHTLCPKCQAEMVSWRLANPNATKVDAESAHCEIWLNCPPCSADYAAWNEAVDAEWQNDPEAQRKFDEWCAEQERLADEAAMCEVHDADAHELASLGCAGRSYIAGHDAIWQEGGDV